MTQFSAGSQALGYIYQLRYALYLILTKEDRDGVAIECLDDVVWENNGNLQELLQLKHHTNKKASLTNASSDLWKTIRVWATYVKERKINLSKITLTLITTAKASENSIASFLRNDNRNIKNAHQGLIKVTQKSKTKDKTLRDCFDTFLSLSAQEQIQLLNSVYILDSSPNILDLEKEIKRELRSSAKPKHLDLLYERVEGWWFAKVITNLREGFKNPITWFEVNNKIQDIRDQFTEDALPIDFRKLEVPEDFDAESRIFVRQLQAIASKNTHIERAIRDYYRAFKQRSRWLREKLVFSRELEEYEDRLVDEWERYKDHLEDEGEYDLNNNEEDCQKFGRKIFKHIDQEMDCRIRSNVSEPYVMRGSYHILADADQPKIYWHPQFLDRLTQLLEPIESN